jgi:hypothetical protein
MKYHHPHCTDDGGEQRDEVLSKENEDGRDQLQGTHSVIRQDNTVPIRDGFSL